MSEGDMGGQRVLVPIPNCHLFLRLCPTLLNLGSLHWGKNEERDLFPFSAFDLILSFLPVVGEQEVLCESLG